MNEKKDCPYCQGSHYISSPRGRCEIIVEIDTSGIPCLIFRVIETVEGNSILSMGVKIKYCPMCGRRLDNG